MTGEEAPLILTALLPRDLHARFTAMRAEYFPPERNFLEAHVTLFHALPAICADEMVGLGKRLAAEFAPVGGRVTGLMSLGGGTAIRLESAGMLHLRDLIAEHFHGLLTGQDQHSPQLHVTIQNKVPSAEARALQSALRASIETRAFAFVGLGLYRYVGGPWDRIKIFAFRGSATA